jgi:hypothetical protein
MAKYREDVAYIEDQQCNDRVPVTSAANAYASARNSAAGRRVRYNAVIHASAFPGSTVWSPALVGRNMHQQASSSGGSGLWLARQLFDFVTALLTFFAQVAGVFFVIVLIAKYWLR